MNLIEQVAGQVYSYRASLALEKKLLKERKAKQNDLSVEISKLQQVSTLCALCMKERVDIKQDIEDLDTILLQSLNDDSYSFKWEEVLNKDGVLTGLAPAFYEFGSRTRPNRNGGANRATVGFGNRFAFVIRNPELAPVLVLDEFGSNFNGTYWDKFIEYVSELTEKLNCQVFIISNSGAEFPRSFQVSRVNKVSKVTEVY